MPEVYSEGDPWKPATPWVTWLLIGSTVAVFLLQLLVVHLSGVDEVGNALAFTPEAIAQGHFWTLLTYAWAHAVDIFGEPGLFWLHIAANMIPLYCLGPALEDALGHGRYLGLYLGGALAAALYWYVLNLYALPGEGVIGASGAVFALIAAAGTLAPRARVVVYLLFVVPLRMNLRNLALLACGIEALQIIFHWLPEIAHSAHLGGAAFGCLYVLGIRHFSLKESFAN